MGCVMCYLGCKHSGEYVEGFSHILIVFENSHKFHQFLKWFK